MEVIVLALFDEHISMDSITSGAEPNLWEPIRIDPLEVDEREKKDGEETGTEEPSTPAKKGDGVTSGSDTDAWVDVKSSQRKNRKP